MMKRFVNGIMEDPIWQKRVPQKVPDWLQTATVSFPSGRTAEELVANDAAHLVWAVNLGVIDFNPWPCRRADLDHPDELRVDLDPGPGVGWDDVRRVALVARDVLTEHGLRGYPKTSGSKGIHVNWCGSRPTGSSSRCGARRWRSRGRSRGARPTLATAKWWKEERHGVFVDYNQNARDRTVASGYSVRPTPDARVSCALEWAEVRRRRARRPAAGHGAGAAGLGRRSGRRHRRRARARWTRCSTSRGATRRAGSATRRGRRTSRRRRASPSGCSPAATPTARRSAAAPATRSPAGRRRASRCRIQRGFGSKPRTGQGHEHDSTRSPSASLPLRRLRPATDVRDRTTCVRCGVGAGVRLAGRAG